MSSAVPAQKHEWLIILPDYEAVLEKRMEVRPEHLKNIQPGFKTGFWRLGGAILEEPFKGGPGEVMKITGSVMLAYANSREEVLSALQEDTYFRNGVWDWEKFKIYPFRTALHGFPA